MLATFTSELHGDIRMLQGTDVLSSVFSYCMIMTIGSGEVMGHAQWILTVEDKREPEALIREQTWITSEVIYIFMQIISENISLSYGSNL